MKKLVLTLGVSILTMLSTFPSYAQDKTELPIKGFCIAAPRPDRVDDFVEFIDKELAPAQVNTLILRVDWNYQYSSHPELADSIALSQSDVKKMLKTCKENNINLVPQINFQQIQLTHLL